ncbi:MAG: hypothetical protein HXX10_19690, partial [Rhodoplanes sp.]|nr:hypothetical protein [Rhodoplanes sp.]
MRDPAPPHADPTRRTVLSLAAGAAATFVATAPADAQPRPPRAGAGGGPVSAFGVDAATLGVRPGSPDDQTAVLQRALERTAAAGAPLALPPGVYRVGGVGLPDGAR